MLERPGGIIIAEQHAESAKHQKYFKQSNDLLRLRYLAAFKTPYYLLAQHVLETYLLFHRRQVEYEKMVCNFLSMQSHFEICNVMYRYVSC